MKQYNLYKKLIKVKCKCCGKVFETYTKPHKKYCSKKCYIKSKNLKCKKQATFICDYCGKIYQNIRKKINNLHHFCCEEHAKLYRKQHEKKPNHICCVCNKSFYNSHVHIKTCSKKCGNILAKQTKNNFSDLQKQIIQEKQYETKKKNNSFCISKPEKYIKQQLLLKFKDTKVQYKSKKYPFHCDFYIPKKDLYIEYQGTWMHGSKPFEGTEEDLKKLEIWKEKNTTYYNCAINVWTVSDPLKRKTAQENHLNWIEFFTLDEFLNWFNALP